MADVKKQILIDYTNHRGERSLRRIEPIDIVFENSEWHPETQWIIIADDLDKSALRYFAVSGIHSWQPLDSRCARVDLALAKQLQNSMERNTRMVANLKRLADIGIRFDDLASKDAWDAILRNEEPTWP